MNNIEQALELCPTVKNSERMQSVWIERLGEECDYIELNHDADVGQWLVRWIVAFESAASPKINSVAAPTLLEAIALAIIEVFKEKDGE